MIVFDNVTKKYGNNDPVLEKINFLIEAGSFVYLVGPTGSGKTTIFRLIIHDLLPSEGEISIGEWHLGTLPHAKIPVLRRKVGVVFQDLKLLMDRTVAENIMLPLFMSGEDESSARVKADELLISVGLEGAGDKFPLQLSGGERQRVAIARALIFDPEVILADEPTGNLDSATSFQILDLLKSINKKGTTIFMATHNDKIIEQSDDRVIVLEKGKIKEDRKSKNSPHKEKSERVSSFTHDKKEHSKENSEHEKEHKDRDEKSDKIKLEKLAEEKGEKDAS